MHFNSKASHSLHAIAIIATAPRGLPVTALDMAQEAGLSLSGMESIVSKLKKGGLIFAYRGPGGGYQLMRSVASLSVWDVVCHFQCSDLPAEPVSEGSEGKAVHALFREAEEAMRSHLKGCPLTDVVNKISRSLNDFTDGAPTRSPFNLKPLLQTRPPTAPSWVFDLATSSRPAHA